MSDKPMSPCDTCPYRKSTPVGIWSIAEYRNLQRQDRDCMTGSSFGCHKDTGKEKVGPCRGWLADQKRRGISSIGLRMMLIRDALLMAVFEAVDEGNPDLYGSIAEMVAANRGRRFPDQSEKAKRLAARLARKPTP